MLRHGDTPPPQLEGLTSGDPDLYLVHGDMHAWLEAHPCNCEALCLCDHDRR